MPESDGRRNNTFEQQSVSRLSPCNSYISNRPTDMLGTNLSAVKASEIDTKDVVNRLCQVTSSPCLLCFNAFLFVKSLFLDLVDDVGK